LNKVGYLTFLEKIKASPIVDANHRSEEHFEKSQWLPYINSKVEFENPPPSNLMNPGLSTQ
jgi:hypothetical protein